MPRESRGLFTVAAVAGEEWFEADLHHCEGVALLDIFWFEVVDKDDPEHGQERLA